MKIALIGTTSYLGRMRGYKQHMVKEGHEVKLPEFDDNKELDELEICEHNLEMIKWADEVHLFWNQRSTGVIFDMSMCFALRKTIKLIYLEPKTFTGVFQKYEEKMKK